MTEKKEDKIDFHHVPSNTYRTYHVDGIFGGLTPRGLVSMECYLERQPLPTRIQHVINESGQIGDEVERDSQSGIIRDVECGLIMDINTAKSLLAWLTRKIEEYDSIFKGGDTHAS